MGAAAVELGLTLLVLMPFSMGLIDYGYFFYVHHHVTQAAREAARLSVKPGRTCADACGTAKTYLDEVGMARLDSDADCEISEEPCAPQAGGDAPVPLRGSCVVRLRYPVGTNGSITRFNLPPYVPPKAYARACSGMRLQR